MKNLSQLLLALFVGGLLLSGCGQKGPLYLPPSDVDESEVVETTDGEATNAVEEEQEEPSE